MRFTSLFTLLLIVSVVFAGDDTLQQFTRFIQKYNKKYGSAEEFNLRYNNFKNSLQRIAEKNLKYAGKGATYGITKFSDMSPDEFRNTVLMKNKIPLGSNSRDPSQVLPKKKNIGQLPSAYDWRDHGAVTPVKDQGACGSCWAFSVVENIESQWILAGKGTNHSTFLSPQQLVDCNWDDLGCNGGTPPFAYDYVISAGGLESIAEYPYTAEGGWCQFDAKYIVASISSWKFANKNWFDEAEILESLYSWGPLSICVDASNWQDYESGVMTASECAAINWLDHCVDVVGYRNDTTAPAWIVRNSWGEDWGLRGYILLQMWENTCGMSYLATSSVV